MRLIGSKKAVRTAEFHRRQERRRKVKLSIYGVLAFLILISPFVILRSQKQFISDIEVKGGSPNEDEVKALVLKDLEGNYLGFIPKKSIFLFPHDEIVSDLLKNFPQFFEASVVTKETNGLVVNLFTRQPFALYCKEKCYYIDKDGLIYAEAPTFTDGVYSIFSDEATTTNPIGEQFLSSEELTSLDQFFKSISGQGYSPKLLVKTADEYKLILNGGTYLLWNNSQDLKDVLSNLNTVFDNRLLKKSDLESLEYIDLRFGDKVYYKFRE